MRFIQTEHYCYDQDQKEFKIKEITPLKVVLSPQHNDKAEFQVAPKTFENNYWLTERKLRLINEKRSPR